MQFFFSISFILICVAIIVAFGIKSSTFKNVMNTTKKQTLYQQISKKKQSKIVTAYKNTIMALESMGQLNTLYTIIFTSFIAIFFGIFAGITLFTSIYLAIAFAIMLAAIPFIFVRVQYIEYKSLLLEEMETALSVITSSIERTDNILEAFKENMAGIQKPLSDIFAKFVFAVEHNISINDAIDTMKQSISNPIFLDWCDVLKLVAKDRNMKYQLRPIVTRITDIKIATTEARNILFTEQKNFKTVLVLSVFFMLISYVVVPLALRSAGGSEIELGSFVAICFTIDILMLFFMSLKVYLLTRDIDFENV